MFTYTCTDISIGKLEKSRINQSKQQDKEEIEKLNWELK